MHSADYAVARCPSVRPSVVRLPHAGIISKRLYISSHFSPSGSPIILLFPHQTGWCVLFAPSGECYIAYGRKIALISTVRLWWTENSVSTHWMSVHVDGQLHFLLRDAVHKRGLCRRAVSVRLSRSCIMSKRLKIRPRLLCNANGKPFLQFFLPSGSHTTLVLPYQTSW